MGIGIFSSSASLASWELVRFNERREPKRFGSLPHYKPKRFGCQEEINLTRIKSI